MTRSTSERTSLLRLGEGASAVTTIELFFDLVYVFAITKLSGFVTTHLSWGGALQTAILLAMVWQVWIYTTWATNFADPRRHEVRFMLIGVMFGSLLFASALGGAFGGSVDTFTTADRGLFVAVCYVSMQVGRCLFMVWAMRGEDLRATFQRIVVWSSTSGALMIAGGLVSQEHVHVREALWASAIVVEVVSAAFGFWVPRLGRSDTHDWRVAGSHFAERCQAFMLIALGESIAVTGSRASTLKFDATGWISIIVVFATSVGFWWLYFDRAADDSAAVINRSDDPGRLARNAFHWIHPIMIGGVILTAAAAELILDDRAGHTESRFAWLILGGGAMFLIGHALFKRVVWQTAPVTRLIGVAVLAVAGLFAPHVAPLTLGIVVLAVVVAVAISDRMLHPPEPEPE
ncbi:MAG TPA: low temperature requirement protein A [Jatrophihabitantaceae bacterium]|nr:low temperature requirement protein A [Jatrophihabitantaceae bacterium]